jgi:hypothetical protein
MWPLYQHMEDSKSPAMIDLEIAKGLRPLTDPNAIARFEELFGQENTHNTSPEANVCAACGSVAPTFSDHHFRHLSSDPLGLTSL